MRVLWVGHFVPYPPRGGSMQRSFNLIRQAGKAVELHFVGAALAAQQATDADLEEARRALRESCASVRAFPAPFLSSRAGKATVALRALLAGTSYSGTWLDLGSIRRRFADAIAETKPAVIHVDSVQIAHLLPAVGPPAVLTHHNVESHMMERRAAAAGGWMGWFLRREALKLAALERDTAGRYARHVFCSDLDVQRIKRMLPDLNCSVVPNGVDPSYFKPSDQPAEEHTLVFAGRMNQYPNEQAMLRFIRELLPEIRRRAPRTRLIVAGMNPTPALLSAIGSDPGITVTGFVDDIRPWIARGAVYICPILDGGGTRLKLLDAMALARPIVATPLSMEGIGATHGDQVLIAQFGAPFVDEVVRLLADPDERERLARRAREWVVATFAWEAIGQRLVEAYRLAAATARAS